MRLALLPAIMAQNLMEVQELQAVDINPESITVTFLPSDYDVEITIQPPAGKLVNPGNYNNRTFTGLEPGMLYTFVAVNTDGVYRSIPVSINQDTVPPQPDFLELSTFEVLTVEVTFFGSKVPHRIDTSGILAEWSPPTMGNCDCYQASIGPNEGLQIEPKDEGGEVRFNTFIQTKMQKSRKCEFY